MKKSICCFTGHSKISAKDDVYEKLKSIIVKLIKEKNVCEFFLGNYGEFDMLSAKAVREIKSVYDRQIRIYSYIYKTPHRRSC